MRIALVTNLNGAGLQQDAELLQAFLVDLKHDVSIFQYDAEPKELPQFDIAIFLEVLPQQFLGLAKRRWWFVNPEFAKSDKIETANRFVEKVFTKTREAQRIMEEKLPGKTHYVGFLCRDQYMPDVPRKLIFLCVAGQSIIRGAEAVYDAWRWKKNGESIRSNLIILSSTLKRTNLPANVEIIERIADEEEFKRLQNMCQVHLCLSGTEGYGHALHEALSVGAMIVTTGAPPMNEVRFAEFVDAQKVDYCGCADIYEVSALDIYEKAKEIENFYTLTRYFTGAWDGARQEFLDGVKSFKEAFAGHLAELQQPDVPLVAPAIRRTSQGKKCVAFLGNFEASESTENMIKWALTERLNMEVLELQENKTNLATLEAVVPYADYFLWVRTPGWLNVEDSKMKEFLASLRDKRVPSLSLHLDKFWSIPDREALIGVHPFWLVDFCFTADGSRQEDFAKRGVRHFWMKPAVSEEFCHPGRPREEFRCDVMFCGAREYHSEYPFRAKMVDSLKETYGNRFRHLEGVRGHLLNDAYASAKVIVGDCFQAGTPFYVSDRLMETTGRFGFLLHPEIEGIETPVAIYKPQDLDDLMLQIDFWLAHDDERKKVLLHCANHTHKYDTWTKRMEHIFYVVDNAERTITA